MCAKPIQSSADGLLRFDGTMIDLGGEALSIRRLSACPADALASFFRSLGLDSQRLFDPHQGDIATIERYLERDRDGEDLSFLALSESGVTVAYFFLWEAKVDVPLLGIGIIDAYQNRGLGHRLMHLLIEVARSAGRHGIDLTTMQDNERAFHLYESCGFRFLGEVPNLTGDGRRVFERRMFLPLIEGARAPDRMFGPPDSIEEEDQ